MRKAVIVTGASGGIGLIGSTTVAILRQVHHLFGRCAHRQRHAPSAGALS